VTLDRIGRVYGWKTERPLAFDSRIDARRRDDCCSTSSPKRWARQNKKKKKGPTGETRSGKPRPARDVQMGEDSRRKFATVNSVRRPSRARRRDRHARPVSDRADEIQAGSGTALDAPGKRFNVSQDAAGGGETASRPDPGDGGARPGWSRGMVGQRRSATCAGRTRRRSALGRCRRSG
jgi:hypothetical protein